jgi:hypothetical protein
MTQTASTTQHATTPAWKVNLRLLVVLLALIGVFFLLRAFLAGPQDGIVTEKNFSAAHEYEGTCMVGKVGVHCTKYSPDNWYVIINKGDKGNNFDLTQQEWNQVSKGDHLVFKHRHLVSINGHAVKNVGTSDAG